MSRLSHTVGAPFGAPEWTAIAGWASVAVVCGVALAVEPLVALVPVAVLAAIPLVLSARARFVVVVFGALFIFQTSDELTAPKLGYLFALMVSMGAVVLRLPSLMNSPAYEDLKPMLRASAVTSGVILASLPVASMNGVPLTGWLRDVAPYAMVAFAPLLALDAQSSMSARALRRILVAGGFLGAVAFSARWLTNRQIADLSFVPVGLPTLLLASTLFAYGVAVLLNGGRRQLAWAGLTAFVFAMLLATGTRTVLVLLAAPLAIVIGSRHLLVRRSLRIMVVTPAVVVLVLVAAQGIISATNADRNALAARTSLLFSTGERRSDMSYVDRLSQTEAAWESFRSAPLMGTGPGVPIVWTDALGKVQTWTVIDSPVSFITKFGALGLVAAGFLILGYVGSLRAFRRRTGGPTIAQLALVGFGAVVVGWTLLQNPYEDKGFAIGLALLLSVGAREAADSHSEP